jgi:GMP reductase
MKIEDGVKLDYSDVLIRPKRSTLTSRKEVSLERTFQFKHSHRTWSGTPIMAANMDGVGTLNMAKTLGKQGIFTCLVKSYSVDQVVDYLNSYGDFRINQTAVSIGINEPDLIKFEEIKSKVRPGRLNYVCIDVANGYSQRFVDVVRQMRKQYPNLTIIAGNVVTREMTEELIMSGADIVKIGIGPGAVCTTRLVTGVGYPQLSAVIECADAAHGLGGHVIADGGCTCPGDVAKAFGAGADFVMLGSMLAGHEEGGGDVITKFYETTELEYETGDHLTKRNRKIESKQFVEFYGMSSDTAMNKHHGGVAEYRSSEGRTVKVPYRGSVDNTLRDLLGGIRSTCTYCGASNLKQLSKCTTFVRVNNQYNKTFT